MRSLLQDIHYALRQLRKSPGFAITALLTLSVGIAWCTAIFSVVDAVLLEPLPYPHPERLVSLQVLRKTPGSSALVANEDTSYPNFFDWRRDNKSFEAMTTYAAGGVTLADASGQEARRERGVVVSSDFLTTLGVNPELGRSFQRNEENAGNRSVVISHDLWKARFQQRPDALGKSIRIDDEPYTIIGIMPQGFSFPISAPDAVVWTTMSKELEGKDASATQRGWNQVQVLGRLKPGVSIERGQADIGALQHGISLKYPDDSKNESAVKAVPELEHLVGDVRIPLRILFAAVCSLLLIACANVAGLLLARITSRRGELAVRAALGASRAQIVRQALVECLSLSLMGGLLGIAAAAALIKAAPTLLSADLPRVTQISMDGRAVLFGLAASIVTGLLFGVFPAARMSRLDPAMAMRDGGRGSTAGRSQHRLHSMLVIGETAICLVLLVGAGLLIRSFERLTRVDPGFQPQGVLTFRVGVPEKRYSSEQTLRLFNDLLPRLAALPGAKSATDAFPLPLTGSDIDISFSIDGQPTAPGDEPGERVTLAGPDFFHSLGIPVEQGRAFNAVDQTEDAQPVVIVNEAFARKYFPNQSALGKRMTSDLGIGDKKPSREIVGIAGDVKRTNLAESAQPEYYIPLAQAPIAPPEVAMRVSGDPLSYANEVRSVVARADASLPVYRIKTYQDDLARTTAQQRFQTTLLAAFASIALLLAAIGLYAVLSYMVEQRRMELGLRVALGAQRGHILRMILNRGLLLAAIGLACGLALSAALARFVSGMLYGIHAFDPVTYLTTTAVLLAVSGIAGFAPAWRASLVDPNETLRDQ